jgi:hypothetical protein
MKANAFVPFMLRRGDGSTLSLDFTAMSGLDSRFTFSRASIGTYIDSAGLVASVSNDVPRFDHDPTTLAPRGLLLEGSATNLLTYSEDYSQAAWTKQNVARTTGQSSPDNQTGATLLEENTTSYVKHGLERSITITAGVHTFSVWVKEPSSNSRRYVCLQLADGQATAARYTIVADLQTGTITASGATNGTAGAPTNTGHSITAYPNGWYRLSITMNCVASPVYPAVFLSDTSTLFGGNNQPFYSAASPYKGLIVWGAQLETGSGASSYIPTGAGAVQRTADSCSIALSSFGFSTTGGTFYVDFFRGNFGSVANAAFGTDYTTTRWFGIQTPTASNTVQLYTWSGATSSANGSTRNKVGASYGAWTGSVVPVSLAVNNTAAVTGNRDFNPSLATQLTIGANSASAGSSPPYGVATRDWLNNCVVRLKYWPFRLDDTALRNLTI